jgi:hypothetical protein
MTAAAARLIVPGAVPEPRICRGCGCTDARACPGGCAWVLLDIATPTGICSRCAVRLEWQVQLLATVDNIGLGALLEALTRPDPVICPACKGERRGPDGRLCERCGGSAQFDRSKLRPGEAGAFEG